MVILYTGIVPRVVFAVSVFSIILFSFCFLFFVFCFISSIQYPVFSIQYPVISIRDRDRDRDLSVMCDTMFAS